MIQKLHKKKGFEIKKKNYLLVKWTQTVFCSTYFTYFISDSNRFRLNPFVVSSFYKIIIIFKNIKLILLFKNNICIIIYIYYYIKFLYMKFKFNNPKLRIKSIFQFTFKYIQNTNINKFPLCFSYLRTIHI